MSESGHRGGRFASSPPTVDESYWSALLQEGECAPVDDEMQSGTGWYEDDGTVYSRSAEGPSGADVADASDWTALSQAMAQDQTLEMLVTGCNRGGLLVQWRSLRGFVPASQLVNFRATNNELMRRQELSTYMGQTLALRIIELDKAQNRLILSERAAQVNPGTRETILSTLRAGDTCRGLVTNVCDFGIFVDLGGVEGLIHISELSWGRVGHPGDVLKRGEHVTVFVMDVNKGEGRVALSLKRLREDPWQTVHERYHVGQIVTGVVTNVVDFGAFACIEQGLEGLIHISELAEGHFLHPRNVVSEGDTIQARILNIDGPSRRLGLSLREQKKD